MARLVGVIHRYIGVSTETKPFVGQVRQEDNYVLTAADLPVGSTFYEEDTGWEFTYKGGQVWELSPDSGRTVLTLAKLDDLIGVVRESLVELRAIKKGIALAVEEDLEGE